MNRPLRVGIIGDFDPSYTKHGHKLRFCFEQKATIMGILTSIPMSSSLGLRRIPHDSDRVY